MHGMNRLSWLTNEETQVGNHQIPCTREAEIRRDEPYKVLKSALWPIVKLRNDLLINGFIQRDVGKWINELITKETVFLDVGCGDMGLRRFLPRATCYNALDISLSEFHLARVLKERRCNNIVAASATRIPVESNSVNLVASTECFEHVRGIESAIDELWRISMPDARLICSIPNNYCVKYYTKGPHEDHVNNWTFKEFIKFMNSRNFEFVKGHMKGFWIPTPWFSKTRYTRASYQLPISGFDEARQCNFFYMFKVVKD
jgi:ubiquinone/menaquinone biosynthesis C-methylase UbiE